MQYVKALPEPPPRRRLLSGKQKEALWAELEKDTLLYRLIGLAVNLPLRRGQLVTITEDVIEFEKRTRSCDRIERKTATFSSTKRYGDKSVEGDD